MRFSLPLLAVAFAMLLLPSSATASFPGSNGILAVTEGTCDGIFSAHVQAYTESGRRLGEITPFCDRYISGGIQPLARSAAGADWSPDGRRLLYLREAGGGEERRFETVAPDGSGRTRVSPDLPQSSPGGPSFAPDGRRFAYVDRADGTVRIAPGDGGPAAALLADRQIVGVRWSPNGRHLAVARVGTPDQAGLWIHDAATGNVVRRVVKRAVGGVDWAPGGRRMVFATQFQRSHGTGKVTGANLYVVRADGKGKARRVVRTRDVAATSAVWSPDGRSLAWVQARYTRGDVGFEVFPSLWRMRISSRRPRKLVNLPSPDVEEGSYVLQSVDWQPVPRP